MSASGRVFRSFVFFLSLCGALDGGPIPTPKPFLTPVGPEKRGSGPVQREQDVRLELNLLRGPANKRLTLPLFDGVKVVLVRDRQERPDENIQAWYGHIQGQPGSAVVLTSDAEGLEGTVIARTPKRGLVYYEIEPVRDRLHALRKFDPAKIPRESPPAPQGTGLPMALTRVCTTDPPSQIDVLVVYTEAARLSVEGPAKMRRKIRHAVNQTNDSYDRSDISQRLRLVHLQEVPYKESEATETGSQAPGGDTSDPVTSLARLLEPADGFLDDVPPLRDSHSADVVVLIVKNLASCGKATNMEDVSPGFEASAYALVRVDCATRIFSFAHELGHLMGARHDWGRDSADWEQFHKGLKPAGYNHGYITKKPPPPGETPWQTIMGSQEDHGRILQWSNPSIEFDGEATGILTGDLQADNHKRLNETAPTVTNFRCASAPPDSPVGVTNQDPRGERSGSAGTPAPHR